MVKFVFFDIGGVLIRDFNKTNKWEELKKFWGVNPEKGSEFDKWYGEVEIKVSKGLPIESFIPEMRSKFGLDLKDDRDILKDFLDRFEANEYIWPLVEEVKKVFPVGLLTNMYPTMFSRLKEVGLLKDKNWEVVVDSSVVKTVKPEEEIFVIAEERAKVKGDEIFFIDNMNHNIEVAKSRNWNTYLYDPSNFEKSTEGARSQFKELTLND